MQIIQHILPEIFLSISIMIILMLGVFIKKSYKLVNNLIILSLIFTTLLIFQQQNELVKIFNENYIIDNLSVFMKILTTTIFITLLVMASSPSSAQLGGTTTFSDRYGSNIGSARRFDY